MEKLGSFKASLRNKHFAVVYHRELMDALGDALWDLNEDHHYKDSGSLGDISDVDDLE